LWGGTLIVLLGLRLGWSREGCGRCCWFAAEFPDVFENRIERKKAFESALSVSGPAERTNTTEPNPEIPGETWGWPVRRVQN
jgi:hypothetical protein